MNPVTVLLIGLLLFVLAISCLIYAGVNWHADEPAAMATVRLLFDAPATVITVGSGPENRARYGSDFCVWIKPPGQWQFSGCADTLEDAARVALTDAAEKIRASVGNMSIGQSAGPRI